MATLNEIQIAPINLNITGESVAFRLGNTSSFTLEGRILSGTWGTAVVTCKRSNSGVGQGFALESATTLTAPGITAERDACFQVLHVEVTTPEGAAGIAELILNTQRDA